MRVGKAPIPGTKKPPASGRFERSRAGMGIGAEAGLRAGFGTAGAGRRPPGTRRGGPERRFAKVGQRCKRTSSSVGATHVNSIVCNTKRQAKLRPTQNIHTICGVVAAGEPPTPSEYPGFRGGSAKAPTVVSRRRSWGRRKALPQAAAFVTVFPSWGTRADAVPCRSEGWANRGPMAVGGLRMSPSGIGIRLNKMGVDG